MYILSTVEYILYFISKIQTTLNCVYNSLLTVGHIIVLVAIGVIRFLHNVIISSGEILIILKEDFEVFQHDLFCLFDPAVKWIQDRIINTFICTQWAFSFLLSLCDVYDASISEVLYVYHCLKLGVYKSLVLLLDSLCLIGNSFIYCSNLIIKLCSIETLLQLSSIVYSYLIHVVRLEALFGLLVSTIFIAVSIKCEIYLKLIRILNILFLKLKISLYNGLKFLMIIPLFLTALKKNWNNVKHILYKYIQKKDDLSKLSTDELQRLLEEEKAEKLCIICMDRKRNIILLNCQHLILCNICVSTILQDRALCPVCRNVIFDIITVYT